MHVSVSFSLLKSGGVYEFVKGRGSVTGGGFFLIPQERQEGVECTLSTYTDMLTRYRTHKGDRTRCVAGGHSLSSPVLPKPSRPAAAPPLAGLCQHLQEPRQSGCHTEPRPFPGIICRSHPQSARNSSLLLKLKPKVLVLISYFVYSLHSNQEILMDPSV